MRPMSSVVVGAAAALQRVLLGSVFDIAAAEISVVVLNALGDVVQSPDRIERARAGSTLI